jgi:hypothetical protein
MRVWNWCAEWAVIEDGALVLWRGHGRTVLRGLPEAFARRLCDEVRGGYLVRENDYPQSFRDLLTAKGLLVEGDGGMGSRLRRLRFRWHEGWTIVSADRLGPILQRLRLLDVLLHPMIVVIVLMLTSTFFPLGPMDTWHHLARLDWVERGGVYAAMSISIAFHELGHALAAHRRVGLTGSVHLRLSALVIPSAYVRWNDLSNISDRDRLWVSLAGVRYQWALAALIAWLGTPVSLAIAGLMVWSASINLLPLPGFDGRHAVDASARLFRARWQRQAGG